MAQGNYLSLEEAHNQKKLDRFCKDHESEAPEDRFPKLLDTMCRGKIPKCPEEGGEA